MTPEEWNNAKALFDAALAQEPSEREAFLAQKCPDDHLRKVVENLLINFREAGSFLSNAVFHPYISRAHPISRIRSAGVWPSSRAGLLSAMTPEGADDPMLGQHIGVYELRRRIGQGGMAAVFLGHRADGEFRKEVAIKLLLPGLEEDKILDRFRKERQTLAGLEHPNIIKLLDGGTTSEGLPYMVMDYVEGSPIDEYCDAHRLSVEQRLRLFCMVCDAVQYAHQNLVIHRDLKPSNILVTADGVPKLLDFGIAKVLEPTTGLLALTHTGERCMTPIYASPEQVRCKSVTATTDIYSLGVVLYELLTGHRPYRLTKHTPFEIEQAICQQEPEKLSTAVNRVEEETSSDGTTVIKTAEVVSQTREGQPERLRRRLHGDLDNIVLKALQKEAERRYSSVEEFRRDIDRHLQHQAVKARRSTLIYRASKLIERNKVGASAASVFVLVLGTAAWLTSHVFNLHDRAPSSSSMPIQSLAVLPFLNLSGDPAQEYMSDGMTEALITDLAQIGSLKVISRTSTAQYKQTNKPPREIARELNVDAIVEGAVQRSRDRVRITAQLIDGHSDRHLWANSYERMVSDVFALEEQISGDIADEVRAPRTKGEQAMAAQHAPINLTALEAYLEGNYHLHKSEAGPRDEELRRAGNYFQRAIDADPKFAPAYVGLSKAHEALFWPSSNDFQIMSRAAEHSIALDPTSSDARVQLGNVKAEDWDWSGAEEQYRRAIALSANSASAHGSLGSVLDRLGRFQEGWSEQEIAQQLDPNQDHLSGALYLRGQYDRTIALLRRESEASPRDAVTHWFLSEAYAQKGMYAEAVQELGKSMSLTGLPEVGAHVQRSFSKSGWRVALLQWVQEVEQLQANKQGYFPGILAETYVRIGDNDRAFYWLDQGLTHRHLASSDPVLQWVKVAPSLVPLRSDPRFNDILRRGHLGP